MEKIIGKALYLALQNGKKCSDIFSIVSHKESFEKLELSEEKEKIINFTLYINQQLKRIVLESFVKIKSKNKKNVHIDKKNNYSWDHLTTWDKIDCCVYHRVQTKNGVKAVYFYLWICPLVKPTVYDIGMFISFDELESKELSNDREGIEKELCEILGREEWMTSNEDYFQRRQNTATKDELETDFKNKGGYVAYKEPIILKENDNLLFAQSAMQFH